MQCIAPTNEMNESLSHYHLSHVILFNFFSSVIKNTLVITLSISDEGPSG